MPKGIYKRRLRVSKYPLKKRLHCPSCYYAWEYKDIYGRTSCPVCGKLIDARDRREYAKAYILLHPERKHLLADWLATHKKEHSDRTRADLMATVFALITKSHLKPICNSCGCDDRRLLEINHKNGGGGKELAKGYNSVKFYRDIAGLRRKVDDLEILCRVCNAKHYLELKYGKLPIKVVWECK